MADVYRSSVGCIKHDDIGRYLVEPRTTHGISERATEEKNQRSNCGNAEKNEKNNAHDQPTYFLITVCMPVVKKGKVWTLTTL